MNNGIEQIAPRYPVRRMKWQALRWNLHHLTNFCILLFVIGILMFGWAGLWLGIPVLFSAVAATRRERLREGVLLKTLGATRRQIMRIMLAEYVLLGTLGALTGVLLSTLSGWALMHWIFRMDFSPSVLPVAIVALAMISLAVAIGLLTGRDVFAETPMAALRES